MLLSSTGVHDTKYSTKGRVFFLRDDEERLLRSLAFYFEDDLKEMLTIVGLELDK
jgi:hypothetical protein